MVVLDNVAMHAARYKDIASTFLNLGLGGRIVTRPINFPIESRLGEGVGWCQVYSTSGLLA
jgi:hypothetical protein